MAKRLKKANFEGIFTKKQLRSILRALVDKKEMSFQVIFRMDEDTVIRELAKRHKPFSELLIIDSLNQNGDFSQEHTAYLLELQRYVNGERADEPVFDLGEDEPVVQPDAVTEKKKVRKPKAPKTDKPEPAPTPEPEQDKTEEAPAAPTTQESEDPVSNSELKTIVEDSLERIVNSIQLNHTRINDLKTRHAAAQLEMDNRLSSVEANQMTIIKELSRITEALARIESGVLCTIDGLDYFDGEECADLSTVTPFKEKILGAGSE